MDIDFSVYLKEAVQVSLAFVMGAIIGLEREFRSKPAGFRTMILICVGSCLFTIISKNSNAMSPDRIASNIVTGIGFIGAGVIFKEGMSVNGLTTASLIWITAALGMAIGYNDYPLAIVVCSMVVVTLFVLEPIQRFINKLHRVKDYKIKTNLVSEDFKQEMELFLATQKLKFFLVKLTKEDNDAVYIYRVSSPDRNYDVLNNFLLHHQNVRNFEA
ncbi:MAG: MgtC/SapB family protein [Chitinophagaceae bacterium]|jgi:putative Mg2+ transporter-C (MgtC) family protein